MKRLRFWRNWTDAEVYLAIFAGWLVFGTILMVLGSDNGSR